jgi:hypothetical protein
MASRRIDVTVPCATRRPRPGIAAHTSVTLTDGDVTLVRGIPCTTIPRTLLDLAEVLDRRGVERALDQAEILQKLYIPALLDQCERNAHRGAATKLRQVLAEHYAGSTATWSELEERFLALIREANLPAPEVNALLVLGDGEPPIHPDFLWREQRIVVEVDGHRTHGTRQAFERDRRRDQRLIAAGWRTLRVTWRQLERTPHEVIAALVALMHG